LGRKASLVLALHRETTGRGAKTLQRTQPDHDKIEALWLKVLATKDEDELQRVAKDLHVAIAEHVRQGKNSLRSKGRAIIARALPSEKLKHRAAAAGLR